MLKEISIEVIRKCPNRCLHCSSYSTENCSEIISLEKFKEVVDGAKNLGLKTVCFSGGEPFLHPDIVEMIDYVHSRGLSSYIYSSGIYMDAQKERMSIPETILKEISKKVTKIIINIEAAEELAYDTIMGTQGNFQLMITSIKCAVENGILVEGHFVPNKINKNQIEKTLELCEMIGVSKVSFLRLVIHGRAVPNKEKLRLSNDELKEIECILHKIQAENKYSIRIGVPLSGETQESHCEAANGKLNIRYDGLVYPCEVFKNNKVGILDGKMPGSIYESRIEDIYRSSDYLETVRGLVNQFSCGDCCENCVGQYYMNLLKGESQND